LVLKQIFTLFLFFGIIPSFSQTPAVVISSYYNADSPVDEWTELLVIKDNTNMVNWKLQNSNSTQTIWQPAIIFSDSVFWNHMRAGTIIKVDHRCCKNPEILSKGDGYIEIAANDPNLSFLTGGNFGNPPGYNGPTLNIDPTGGLLVLMDSSGNIIHALGHRPVPGPLFNSLPLPKLNYDGTLNAGEAVFVCPGSNSDEYGYLAPQDGSTWTSAGAGSNLTPGLPNICAASTTANADYWISLRQPQWINPTLIGWTNGANNLITLNWNAQEDAYPPDFTQKYLILRNTTDNFDTPVDGRFYFRGDHIGGAVVVKVIEHSQTLTFVDTVSVPCSTGLYYRIYSFRYSYDYLYGNNYNPARGSAYNETSFASTHVSGVLPIAPTAASCDRDTLCSNDNGTITLSAVGGSGETLNWYIGGCGGTQIGTSFGGANSITALSPDNNTTYYAGWENSCGTTSCVGVTVFVIPAVPVSLTITSDSSAVCEGTYVTFTSHPVNEGNSPVYTWTLNGDTIQSGSSPIFTEALKQGDFVKCWLTSSVTCPQTNPIDSPPLAITIYPSPFVNLTDQSYLCAGDPIQLDAGSNYASYIWQDGNTSRYYTATNIGEYSVMVTDVNGCKGGDTVHVKNCDSTVFVPNAFSPNNDRLNDVFRAVSTGDNITRFSMKIFDRWGALIFESNDIYEGWTGEVKTELAPSDTYIWIITYQQSSVSTNNVSTVSKRGTVVLLR
jgi:gliding motility-associated-like protein